MATKSRKSARKTARKRSATARVSPVRTAGRDRGKSSAQGVHLAPVPTEVALPAGAIYLYAISTDQTSSAVSLPGLGIDASGRVLGVPAGHYTAWISGIDAASFAQALEQNMENLDWLAEATLRHQNVITAIAGRSKSTLLPTRFGVVFSSVSALQDDIGQRKKEIARAAKHVEGCEEWGVKVFQEASGRAKTVFQTAASGSDYLRKKAAALGSSSGEDADLRAFAKDLRSVARDVARSGKVSAGQRGLQWQATFLVPRSKRKQWDNVLRKYAQQWGGERSIECTGPWPPYSFVASNHG
jgi:hypothetical protein